MEKLLSNKNSSGQTLLEAVIALAALLLILSASSIAIVTSVNNATFTRNQNQANKFAQAGIEEIRSLRDTDYTYFRDFIAGGDTPGSLIKCLNGNMTFSPATSIPNTDCSSSGQVLTTTGNNKFVRYVEFIRKNDQLRQKCFLSDGAGFVKDANKGTNVRVTVKWASGRCESTQPYCHSSYVESCVFPPL